jgi:predicted GH43/DUF377 family glycosyl hydrolase
MTYVAVSKHGAATALASTTDFQHFVRHGIIFAVENKDVVLFPDRVGDRFAALHRPNGATRFSSPEMWIARSHDLLHWGSHEPLHVPLAEWESGRIGGGAPPVRVEDGWLEIYHGNRRPTQIGEVGCYQGAAMLLSADEPGRVLKQAAEPLLWPTEPFERGGFVNDVVFPTGVIERGDEWLIFYGAGDACTAVARMRRADVLATLKPVSS